MVIVKNCFFEYNQKRLFSTRRIMKGTRYLVLIFLIVSAGCSKNDDPFSIDGFYNGSDDSASIERLKGVWAIFSAEFEGERTEVPINYSECGRDFFVYSENGTYNEYLYQSSACEPLINELSWELNEGIISLRNSLGQTDDIVITKLNSQELIFKSRFDVDEDGELDVLILFARKYEPNEIDLYSRSFMKNRAEEFETLISFTWDAYKGFNEFDKYEIYRSSGEGCSKANAELVITITDSSITEFTDLNPPAEEKLCYFLRIYTNKGLLGESQLYDINPSFFAWIEPVSLNQPKVLGNQIELNWEASNSPYFSHYELTFSNTKSSSPQEHTIAIIDDKDITSFVHENPPYIEDPFYNIYVHNIFGNKSIGHSDDVTVYWEVPFKRKEIINLQEVFSYDIDSSEPIIYLYGRESGNEGFPPVNIRRFNYNTHETESISNINPNSLAPIKVVSSLNGKEVIIQEGTELLVYNALTMEYKYAIDPGGVFAINDFTYYAPLDIWLIADGDDIFTLRRDNSNLFLIDSASHFPDHQGNGNYRFFTLKDNQIMLGHFNEPNSIVYTLDDAGNVLSNQIVPIKTRSINNEKTLYSEQGDYLLDTPENRLYSTLSFQFLESFEFPNFPSGTSVDGSQIYGTNNDPKWEIKDDSPHKKEVIIYDRNLKTNTIVETIGYPHILFENYNGEIISLSTGLKRNDLSRDINNKADIFIEKVELP